MSLELGIRSQIAIQWRQQTDSPNTPFIGREEPIMEISSSRYRGSGRPTTAPRGLTRGKRLTNNNSTPPKHNCRNCGQPWEINHRVKCQAIGQTCRRCNKPNHYAKVCRWNLNRQQSQRSMNEVNNRGIKKLSQGIKMISLDPDIHSMYEDSAEDYSVNMMDIAHYPTTR